MKVKLPPMSDCNGCGACCGPVTASPRDLRKLKAFVERRKIKWHEHDDPLVCGFYDAEQKRCRVYSVRPFACRAFGVITEMKCPFFPKAAKQSLPPRDAILMGAGTPLDPPICVEFAADGGKRMIEATVGLLTQFDDPQRAEANLVYIQSERMGLLPPGSVTGPAPDGS